MPPMDGGELGAIKESNHRKELVDRISHLQELIGKTGTNLEAKKSFEEQMAQAQAELAEIGPGETPERVN